MTQNVMDTKFTSNYHLGGLFVCQMREMAEYDSLCNQIDGLLVRILKDSRDYVLKKKAFNELWSEEGTVSFFIISRLYLS